MHYWGFALRRGLAAVMAVALLAAAAPSVAAAQAGGSNAVEMGRRATAYVIAEAPKKGPAFGTAFCIDSSGIFVTNDHVVTDGGRVVPRLLLVLAPGTKAERVVPAKVLKTDARLDVAILKVDRPGELETVELAPPVAVSRLRETMPVMALGFPHGPRLAVGSKPPEVSISTGKITSLRKVEGQVAQIQFDGSINPGNSGGPLLDSRGNVVGIVYAILLDARQINLAKPVSFIWYMLDQANVVLTPRVLTNPRLADELIALLAADPATDRAAVPDAATLEASLKLVRELFADRYTDRSVKARQLLLPDLIEKAAGTKDDPVGRYALLHEAREVAIGVGDLGAAFYATTLIADDYNVDTLGLMTDLVTKMSPRAVKPQDAAMAAAVGLLVLEAKARREEYADARKLLPVLRSKLGAARNPTVVNMVRDRLIRVETEASEYDKSRVALEKLRTAPNDPAASLVVGRYLAFARGDLANGLPMLARGGDAALVQIAKAEMAAPTTVEARKALGDLWWDQAAKEPKTSPAHDRCRAQAAKWYRSAEADLKGLARDAVLARLKTLPGAETLDVAPSSDWVAVGTLESRKAPVLQAAGDGVVAFKVPNHDQWWTGSNGVLLDAGASWEQKGTVWSCKNHVQRPWGMRLIHPLGDGHVLVSLTEKGVTVQAGGAWRDTARNVPVRPSADYEALLPLTRYQNYAIRSELSPKGEYKLFVNDRLALTANVRATDVQPLAFGAGFSGDGLPPEMKKGQAAVVIDHAYHLGNSVAGDLSLFPAR